MLTMAILDGTLRGTCFLGIWDVPTDQTPLNVNLEQWTQLSKSVMEFYLLFDSLKKVQFAKVANDAFESSKNSIPVV